MALRGGMWAVLFTDVVGSTEQRSRLGEEAGDALRREHDEIVNRVLATHRGEFVDSTGDGAMCVFASSADAIAAGVAIQQAIARRNRNAIEPLGLRVGVSVGELVVEGSGLMGLAAHEAARICSLCEQGQVLLSDLVRLMAGSRTDARLLERGSFELKGLAGPVTVWEATWEASEDEPLPIPPRLVARQAWAFSGRERELSALDELYSGAHAGSRRVLLISGEPGIGKTRLATEAALGARERGALVLYGQCDDEIGIPFQPFAEAIDWYLEHATDVVTGRYPGDLSRLSTRVGERLPNVPDPLLADAETEQRRLFDAVVSWLCELAHEQPLVLVLDDLHWATKPTLLMLRHVLRNTEDAPLLVIGTYRDTDLDRRHPLASMLADFRRVAGVERLALTGLDETGVLELLVRVAEQAPGDRMRLLARALVAETEGNPFFVGEVLQHLVEAGAIVRADGQWTSDLAVADLGIPQGVREVVGQRLDRLGDATNDLLMTAAIVGREFTIDLLAAVSGRDPEEVLRALDEAVRARILEEIGLDRFRFSHALVRTTLHDEVGPSRRLRLHRRIAEALEQIDPGNDAALAHHWLEAAAAGDPARAIDHVIRAATRAVDAGAYDDAITLYRRALELIDEDAELGEVRRELLLGLANAQLLGGVDGAGAALIEEIEASSRADDVPRLVRGLARLGTVAPFSLDEQMVGTMLDALERVSDDMSHDRVRLLIATASQVPHIPFGRRMELAEQALAIAREIRDPQLLVDVGSMYFQVMTVPENLEQRLVLAHEIEELGPKLDNRVSRFNALPVQPAWEAGLLDEVDRNDAAVEAICAHTPFHHGRVVLLFHRAKRALFKGDLVSAERWSAEALELGGIQAREWSLTYAAQLAMIRIDQGRPDELIELAEQLSTEMSGTGVESLARSFLARILFESGAVDAAAELLIAEAAQQFEAGGRDANWYPYHAQWAELAAELGDVAAAMQLRTALLPFVERIANFAPVAFGAVSRLVGRLETTLSLYDEADLHLAHAAARHDDLEAMLYLARTWADQAELTIRREDDGEEPSVQGLLDRATTVASERGAAGIQRYIERVVQRARG